MPFDIAAKLTNCRNYTEAKPILETLGVSQASKELMQLYYSQPDNSPYRTRFLQTVVQEVEDGISTSSDKSGPHDKGKNTGDEKPTQEYEMDGRGTGHSSSGSTPEKEGTEKPTTVGDSSAQPTENQMKEMPMGMPGMPPEIQQQMMSGLEKAPPMNPLQQMKMMQYTIQETLKGPLAEIRRVSEGLSKLDSKIQEMETKSVALEIPGGDKLSLPKIQETMMPSGPNPTQQMGYGAQPQPMDNVAEKRMQILEADRIMTAKNKGQDVSQMYQ